MSTLKIAQLNKFCEDEAVRKKIYPVTLLQALFDARTGLRLDRLLSYINCIYLNYCGSFSATMNQIPADQRRAGLIVTFRDFNGIISTVRYKETNLSVADEYWGDRDKWEGWTFDTAINDLASALDVIFKDIDSYPEFKQVLIDTISPLITAYMNNEENITKVKELIKDDIIKAAIAKTEEVWDNACDYEDIKTVVNEGVLAAVNTAFDNLASHEELNNLLNTLINDNVKQEVLNSVRSIFDSIKDDEDLYNVFISTIDNKINDVFYHVWDYPDVADIIRTEWKAKLEDIENDEGLTQLIDSLIHDYVFEVITNANKYPEWEIKFVQYISDTVKCVFGSISKYPELIGAIDQEVHDTVTLVMNDIEHHTGLLGVIDQTIENYICEQFKLLFTDTTLSRFINVKITETITNIFNDLDNYPDIKLNFQNVIKDELDKVISNIDNYPEVKELLDKLARDNRVRFYSCATTKVFKQSEIDSIANGVLDSFPVKEGTWNDSARLDDVLMVEAQVTDDNDDNIIYKAYIFGVISKLLEFGNASIFVEAVMYAPYDIRMNNIIANIGANSDGSFNPFAAPELKDCTNYRQVIRNIILLIRNTNSRLDEFNEFVNNYIADADKKYVHADTLGQPNGIPTLDENGLIEKKFISTTYKNVYSGRYFNETAFADVDGNIFDTNPEAIYVDTIDKVTYHWDGEKYERLDKSIEIGLEEGQALDGYKGKLLMNAIYSLPKNIVSDIKDAKRYTDCVQVVYRGKTKGDHGAFIDDKERVITFNLATEQLAGMMHPKYVWMLNNLGDIIRGWIKDNAEDVLDMITPEGYQFVVVKSEDTHRIIIPEGFEVVRVQSGEPKVYLHPSQWTVPVFTENPSSVENNFIGDPEIITDKSRVLDVPDGYDPLLTSK